MLYIKKPSIRAPMSNMALRKHLFVVWGISIFLMGFGAYLILETSSIIYQAGGLFIGACGFILMVGGWARARGMRKEQLENWKFRVTTVPERKD